MRSKSRPGRSTTSPLALLSMILLGGVVASLLALSYVGFQTLSAARAFVGGEGQWSKARRDAMHSLESYANSSDPADYQAFLDHLAVPLGDKQARLELERPNPDYTIVFRGFEAGKNHPRDVARMATFYRRFRHVSFVEQAIGYWTTGDSLIARLMNAGARLNQAVSGGQPDAARIGSVRQELSTIRSELTVLENSFSAALGEGSRWATRVLTLLLLAVSGVLMAVAATIIGSMARQARRAEEALRSREKQYRELIDFAPFGIARTAIEGRILSANPALVSLLGYASEAELKQVDVHDIYQDPGQRQQVLSPRTLAEGRLSDVEVALRRKDGTGILLRVNGRVTTNADGVADGLEVFFEDVTQRRAMESQLRQAQKMEAVGQFTGGIAHDFNNLLTVILSSASLIYDQLPVESRQARRDLLALRNAGERGAEMIRKLLAFSRSEQLHFSVHPLPQLVDESAEMLRRMLPSSIELLVRHEPPVAPIQTDPALLSQILLNLATNARDAMLRGGKLRLTTAMKWVDERNAALWGLENEGSYPTISVSDTGSGMTRDVRERVFEPFFTTKPQGQGTGLGMAMVYGLMKQHGGHVEVGSEPGVGTSITLYFRPVEASKLGAAQPAQAPERGSGTILVVEDEIALHNPIQRILERQGYRVLLAADGQAGLELFRRHRPEIALILSDVVMPRMSGPEMYRELVNEGVQVPMLFMSGYTSRGGTTAGTLPDHVPFIAKPWKADELVLRIQECLRQT